MGSKRFWHHKKRDLSKSYTGDRFQSFVAKAIGREDLGNLFFLDAVLCVNQRSVVECSFRALSAVNA